MLNVLNREEIVLKSKLYLMFSILLGTYIIYISFNVFSSPNKYSMTSVIWLLCIYGILGYLEFLFFKKYKKYSNSEFKRHEKEKIIHETKLREESIQKSALERMEKQRLIPGSKERKQLLGADFCIKVKHLAGLPVAEGAEVFVYRCEEKVVFERNQESFELDVSNMKDILIKTETEIKKSYASSVGGAVGGYVLFGPLGAMIGGRSKEKTSTLVEKYLIFDYVNKNGVQDFISFEVTNEPDAILFNTNHYHIAKQERTTISL